MLPPLTSKNIQSARQYFPTDVANTLDAIISLKTDVADAHDTLVASRIAQANAANVHRSNKPDFNIDDFVYLSTAHRRCEYLNGNSKQVAKFMPRFDGPYTIVSVSPESSTYTLDLPDHTNVYPTFHVSELKRHVPNNTELYPSQEQQRPGPIITNTGAEEWEIEKILDRRTCRHGHQYLVCWHRYGPEADVWVPGKELEDTNVLQEYNATHKQTDEDCEQIATQGVRDSTDNDRETEEDTCTNSND
jgi:hypothetical protein